MTRRLFNLVIGLSLVLCAVVIVLWVRGYGSDDQCLLWKSAKPARPRSAWQFESRAAAGRLLVFAYRVTLDPPPDGDPRAGMRLWGAAARDSEWSLFRFPPPLPTRLGFGWVRSPMTLHGTVGDAAHRYIGRTSLVSVPLWSVTLLLGLPPLARAAPPLRRRLRTRAGRCPRCGYDLRATPDSCPECGDSGAGAPA